MGLVEDDGFDVTGFWSRRRLRQKLRNLRDDVGRPLFQAVTDGGGSSLYGEPIGWVQNGSWNSAHALIAVSRSAAILAVRQDISYRIFTEGVISDDTGAVILNLMQQDAVVMRPRSASPSRWPTRCRARHRTPPPASPSRCCSRKPREQGRHGPGRRSLAAWARSRPRRADRRGSRRAAASARARPSHPSARGPGRRRRSG